MILGENEAAVIFSENGDVSLAIPADGVDLDNPPAYIMAAIKTYTVVLKNLGVDVGEAARNAVFIDGVAGNG